MYSDNDIHKQQSNKKVSQKKVNYNTNPVSNRRVVNEPDEDFYDDFYRYEKRMEDEDNIEEEPDLETSEKKESRSKVGIVLLLLIILAVVGFLLIKSFTNTPPEETPNPIANISDELIDALDGAAMESVAVAYAFDVLGNDKLKELLKKKGIRVKEADIEEASKQETLSAIVDKSTRNMSTPVIDNPDSPTHTDER
jgi:flagellar basal body-associated protein FliL